MYDASVSLSFCVIIQLQSASDTSENNKDALSTYLLEHSECKDCILDFLSKEYSLLVSAWFNLNSWETKISSLIDMQIKYNL